MKKQLLISVFCVCATLSAMAGEQGVERTDGLVATQTSQHQGQINSSVDEMNASKDETSGQQTFNKLPKDWHLVSELEIVTSSIVTVGWQEEIKNIVPKPIRPPKIGGTGNSSTLGDLVNNVIDGKGGGHSSYSMVKPPLVLFSGGYVKRPIKPGSGSGGGTSSLEDLLKSMTYSGGGSFVSTGHGGKPAGDVNSDGVLNLDDVTTMVDNLLSNQNHGAGNGIGDVTGMIDQLLGE